MFLFQNRYNNLETCLGTHVTADACDSPRRLMTTQLVAEPTDRRGCHKINCARYPRKPAVQQTESSHSSYILSLSVLFYVRTVWRTIFNNGLFRITFLLELLERCKHSRLFVNIASLSSPSLSSSSSSSSSPFTVV